MKINDLICHMLNAKKVDTISDRIRIESVLRHLSIVANDGQ